MKGGDLPDLEPEVGSQAPQEGSGASTSVATDHSCPHRIYSLIMFAYVALPPEYTIMGDEGLLHTGTLILIYFLMHAEFSKLAPAALFDLNQVPYRFSFPANSKLLKH